MLLTKHLIRVSNASCAGLTVAFSTLVESPLFEWYQQKKVSLAHHFKLSLSINSAIMLHIALLMARFNLSA